MILVSYFDWFPGAILPLKRNFLCLTAEDLILNQKNALSSHRQSENPAHFYFFAWFYQHQRCKKLITLTIQRLINSWNLRQSSIVISWETTWVFRKSSCSWLTAGVLTSRPHIHFFKSNKSWKKNYWVCGFNTYFQHLKRLSFLIGCLSEYPQGFSWFILSERISSGVSFFPTVYLSAFSIQQETE